MSSGTVVEQWGEAVDSKWVDIQKRTFTKWCNSHLKERMLKIEALETDLADGVMLCALLELISSKKLVGINQKPKIRVQKLENTGAALRFLKNEGIKLVAIGPEDITDGQLKLILGLIWTIILRYQIQKIQGQGSARNELLQWVRKQIPEYNIQNFDENWNDGKALCALANALEPGIIDLSQMPNKSNLENARTGTEAAEREMKIPAILQPEDLVDPDVDELSVMTYISYFRDYEQDKLKRASAEQLAKLPDPLKCIAYGPGLEKAEVGYPAEFTVQLRNAAGNNIEIGGEPLDIQIKPPLSSPPVKADIVDNGNGTYEVKYVAKGNGKHTILVNVRGKPIQNSPFTVNAERLGVDVEKTEAYGPGLEGGVTKEPTHFTIVTKNKNGDPIPTGGEKFDIKIAGPYNSEVRPEVVDNKNGTYTVNYKPLDKGDHTITILHENNHVANSPYHVKIDSNPDAADAQYSEAYGPGVESIISNDPTTFTIQSYNSKGEKVHHGGDPFGVEVSGPDYAPIHTKITDNKDGSYTVAYTPGEAGKHTVEVFLRSANPLYYDHIKNSPITLDAKIGTDASKTLVYGPGVEPTLLNTMPGEFTIEARDKDGKKMTKGGDDFEVKVTDSNGQKVDAPIVDNGDGTYNVLYKPKGTGKHKVEVKLKDKPVGNTPVYVNVKEGADYNNTHIDSFSFVIRTKTAANQDKKEGGETFDVKIFNSGSDEEVKTVNIKDIGDGTYFVSYNLPEAGQYAVNVKLNGHHIKGSPWKQHM